MAENGKKPKVWAYKGNYVLILTLGWCTFSFQSSSLLKPGEILRLSITQPWGSDVFYRFSLQIEVCSWATAAQLHPPSQEREAARPSHFPPFAQPSLHFNWRLFADCVIDWQVRSGIRQTWCTEQTVQSIKTSFPVEYRTDSSEDAHTHTYIHTTKCACTYTHFLFDLFSYNTFPSVISQEVKL